MTPAQAEGLDPHARRFLRLLAASRTAAPTTLEARRRSLSDLAQLAGDDDPGGSLIVEPLTLAGPRRPLEVRRYAPATAGDGAGLVYLHGGGWCAGDLDTHDGVCRTLAAAGGLTVLSVAYRLAPEHPFPAGLDDAVFAFTEATRHAERFGIRPDRLGLAGDSAGGTLAAAATAVLRETGGPHPSLLLLICPILDLVGRTPSRIAFEEGFFLTPEAFAQDLSDYLASEGDPTDPRVSPLRRADLHDFPPTHVHVAAFDPFRDEGLAYAARLAEAGAPTRSEVHPGMIHYFYALPGLIPAGRPALEAIARSAAEALRSG